MRRAVLVDRDGVICRNRDDHVKNWDEFEFLPGALAAMARLAQTDMSIVVITNQAIINRHMVPVDAVENIHRHMVRAIEEAGGRVDLVTYCPHRPDEHCACRKPQPGLLFRAAEELTLDLAQSYVIGDAEADMQAGRVAGCHRYLVLTGRGLGQLLRCWRNGEKGFVVVPNLAVAARAVLHRANGNGGHTLQLGRKGGEDR